ncbi:unnamed protein product [Clavelina lepadiformis]|uniref:Uncharacterized protein n=1 Tax=Clavelina lepadiformis TaxID=159417 RepID=A0ABP0G3E9_CLALP
MIRTEQTINGRNQFAAGAQLICNPIKEQKCKQYKFTRGHPYYPGGNVSCDRGFIISLVASYLIPASAIGGIRITIIGYMELNLEEKLAKD